MVDIPQDATPQERALYLQGGPSAQLAQEMYTKRTQKEPTPAPITQQSQDIPPQVQAKILEEQRSPQRIKQSQKLPSNISQLQATYTRQIQQLRQEPQTTKFKVNDKVYTRDEVITLLQNNKSDVVKYLKYRQKMQNYFERLKNISFVNPATGETKKYTFTAYFDEYGNPIIKAPEGMTEEAAIYWQTKLAPYDTVFKDKTGKTYTKDEAEKLALKGVDWASSLKVVHDKDTSGGFIGFILNQIWDLEGMLTGRLPIQTKLGEIKNIFDISVATLTDGDIEKEVTEFANYHEKVLKSRAEMLYGAVEASREGTLEAALKFAAPEILLEAQAAAAVGTGLGTGTLVRAAEAYVGPKIAGIATSTIINASVIVGFGVYGSYQVKQSIDSYKTIEDKLKQLNKEKAQAIKKAETDEEKKQIEKTYNQTEEDLKWQQEKVIGNLLKMGIDIVLWASYGKLGYDAGLRLGDKLFFKGITTVSSPTLTVGRARKPYKMFRYGERAIPSGEYARFSTKPFTVKTFKVPKIGKQAGKYVLYGKQKYITTGKAYIPKSSIAPETSIYLIGKKGKPYIFKPKIGVSKGELITIPKKTYLWKPTSKFQKAFRYAFQQPTSKVKFIKGKWKPIKFKGMSITEETIPREFIKETYKPFKRIKPKWYRSLEYNEMLKLSPKYKESYGFDINYMRSHGYTLGKIRTPVKAHYRTLSSGKKVSVKSHMRSIKTPMEGTSQMYSPEYQFKIGSAEGKYRLFRQPFDKKTAFHPVESGGYYKKVPFKQKQLMELTQYKVGVEGAPYDTYLQRIAGEIKTPKGKISIRQYPRIRVLRQDYIKPQPYKAFEFKGKGGPMKPLYGKQSPKLSTQPTTPKTTTVRAGPGGKLIIEAIPKKVPVTTSKVAEIQTPVIIPKQPTGITTSALKSQIVYKPPTTNQIKATKDKTMQLQKQYFGEVQKYQQEEVQRIERVTKVAELSKVAEIQKVSELQKTSKLSRLQRIQRIQRIQKLQRLQRLQELQQIKPITPVAPYPISPLPIFPSERKKKKSSQLQGYHAYAKKDATKKSKTHWVKVTDKPRTYNEAHGVGLRAVDETVARTFKVVKANKPAQSVPSLARDWQFKRHKVRKPIRKGKPIKSDKWIEKTTYAIDSPGEFRGITVKGWKAARQKRRKQQLKPPTPKQIKIKPQKPPSNPKTLSPNNNNYVKPKYIVNPFKIKKRRNKK